MITVLTTILNVCFLAMLRSVILVAGAILSVAVAVAVADGLYPDPERGWLLFFAVVLVALGVWRWLDRWMGW